MNINSIENDILKTVFSEHLDLYNIDTTQKTLNYKPLSSKTKWSLEKIIFLFKDLIISLRLMHKHDITVLYYSLKDIVEISNHYFFINSDKIFPYEGNIIQIDYPVNKRDFSTPEIEQMSEIPYQIPVQSCYYSLASMIVYLLQHKHYHDLTDLSFLNYTPLYYCLKRCLDEDPYRRTFIYL